MCVVAAHAHALTYQAHHVRAAGREHVLRLHKRMRLICADGCYIAESGRVEAKEAAAEAAQAHARELQQTVKSITSERQV